MKMSVPLVSSILTSALDYHRTKTPTNRTSVKMQATATVDLDEAYKLQFDTPDLKNFFESVDLGNAALN